MTGRILVAVQFLFIILIAIPWGGRSDQGFALAVALALAVAGAALGCWTLLYNRPGNFNIRPDPKEGARLITTGPYAMIRHPMYAAVLLVGLGATIFYEDWVKLAYWAMLVCVLWIKSMMEERALKKRFPEYGQYAAGTGRFLPKFGGR